MLVTSEFLKTTFDDVFSNFDRLLPTILKYGLIQIFIFRYFSICSSCDKVQGKITFLKQIFQNGFFFIFFEKFFRYTPHFNYS